jgi:hypothetical protein
MKTNNTTREMDVQAAQALGSLLGQISAIKTKDIRFKSAGPHRGDILAEIDVLGRNHKLVCHVADGQPDDVHNTIKKLRSRATAGAGDTTHVLIAPYLSPQTRALCEESRIGFLDLEGNARLVLDEVFIGKRSCRSVTPERASERLSA